MAKQQPSGTEAPGPVTESVALSDLTLEQLVQLSQGLGRQRDKIDEQMRYLRMKIAERLGAGERESVNDLARAKGADASSGDAVAPGAVIEPAIGKS